MWWLEIHPKLASIPLGFGADFLGRGTLAVDPVDNDAISIAKATIDTVAAFANELLWGLENDDLISVSAAMTITWSKMRKPVNSPHLGLGMSVTVSLRAMMQETVESTSNVLTICPGSLPKTDPEEDYKPIWGSHIDQYDTGSLTGIEGDGVLEDVLTAYNEDAYLWDKCFDLANAVKNAGKCYRRTPDIAPW
ncbi:hypothetical protein BO82DRAFT_404710 [Aspergillus uvarum CBS 121591]|uniref:Uncharacterized protein n=1 Tax=Aspergillus uvarum CBS 121591 TaxID=1448315 RepID=A0A319C4Z0_9EURO|nr:hypothetical protein BO82DRAFT_404710 [Aspergillus uvarum CBS 121591]PYH79047.1 hypothetical protein BO82DRAFT_404710 [Aspergillus uvarum CBS 121591]